MPGDAARKASRKGHKGALTRAINEAKKGIALGRRENVEGSIETIEKRCTDFESSHKEYYNTLVEEAEKDEADTYFDEVEENFIKSILFIRNWLEEHSTDGQRTFEEKPKNKDTELSRAELLSIMNLSKLELETFSGDPLSYHNFMAVFDEHVEKATTDANIKLSRLLQCTKGKAKEAIYSCSLTGGEDGYMEAREILKRRFGNNYLISTRVINNLKSGKQVKSSEDLQKLSDDLQSSYSILSRLERLSEVDTQSAILDIASRLQPYLRNRWKRAAMDMKRERDRYPDFKEFVKFVQREAVEAADPVYGSFNVRPSQDSGKASQEGKTKYTASCATGTRPGRTYPPCVACGGSHRLFGCERFKAMKPIERLQLVTSNKLCENCLLANHSTTECRKPSVCTVPQCGQKHTRFIHIEDQTAKRQPQSSVTTYRAEAITANLASCSEVCLPLVKVMVNDRMKTNALLDSGSTSSFCTQRLVNALGLHGSEVLYKLNTLSDTVDKQSQIVNLMLMSVDGKVV